MVRTPVTPTLQRLRQRGTSWKHPGLYGGTLSEATVGGIKRFHFINAQENENSHIDERRDV